MMFWAATGFPALSAQEAAGESDYRLSVNDLLDIAVYREPDLSKTVRVSPRGEITFPLLGNLMVAGLTGKELEAEITALLAADYLVSPQVSVFIKEYSKISVLGEVKRPGAHELKSGMTLIEAITLAGGFSDKADLANISLTRVKEEEEKEERLIDITPPQAAERGITLRPNDVIVVGELGMVSVIGKVRNPGRYSIEQGMTAVEAIALAGGFTETAAENNVKVIRVQGGRKQVFGVPVGSILRGGHQDKNIPLKSDDTIMVPESFF